MSVECYNILEAFGLTQIVLRPNRIAETWATFIDRIICSAPESVINGNVDTSSLSAQLIHNIHLQLMML